MPSLPVVAIVGRPNVGKSTLFNRLIGRRTAIISDVAGTTRDRVYGTSEWNGRTFTVVDTGGLELEPGTSIEERVQDQARVAIEEADLVLFVVDAHAGLAPLDYEVADRLRRADAPVILVVNKGDNPSREADAVEGYTAQDAHVVGHVLEAGKGIVLVLNKWDAVEKDEHTADQWLKRLRREAPYLAWADIVFASALTGQRVERILGEALRVAEERYRRIPTGELNRLIMDAVRKHPPSHVRNRLPKILYATQVGVAPPTFVCFVNDPQIIHFSYKRYLENQIREKYGFLGTPIRLILRQRESEEDARRSSRVRRTSRRR